MGASEFLKKGSEALGTSQFKFFAQSVACHFHAADCHIEKGCHILTDKCYILRF